MKIFNPPVQARIKRKQVNGTLRKAKAYSYCFQSSLQNMLLKLWEVDWPVEII